MNILWQWFDGKKRTIALIYWSLITPCLPIWFPHGVPSALNKIYLTLGIILTILGLGHAAMKKYISDKTGEAGAADGKTLGIGGAVLLGGMALGGLTGQLIEGDQVSLAKIQPASEFTEVARESGVALDTTIADVNIMQFCDKQVVTQEGEKVFQHPVTCIRPDVELNNGQLIEVAVIVDGKEIQRVQRSVENVPDGKIGRFTISTDLINDIPAVVQTEAVPAEPVDITK